MSSTRLILLCSTAAALLMACAAPAVKAPPPSASPEAKVAAPAAFAAPPPPATPQQAQKLAVAAADSITAGARDTLACPKDGRWRPCSLADRLQRAGLVPHVRPDTARLPFLTPAGQVWTVARAELVNSVGTRTVSPTPRPVRPARGRA